MTSGHTSYEDLASQRRDSDEYRQGRAEAERAYILGRAVRDRRLALGLSQTELATRAGMTQPALSRLEAEGVIPTIPLLDQIFAVLDADLIVEIAHPRCIVLSATAERRAAADRPHMRRTRLISPDER